ncbi:MAG: uroporphyrinogen decarboxylase family protein [Pseudomonadota bacterium]|nr:uroporphyrinogen decarboxylase family protein [Pseudomonadota bacterium]
MSDLTSRERVARALRGDDVDRTALMYLFLGGARHVLNTMGHSMREVHEHPELMALAQATAARLFGHDSAMLPFGCLTVEAEAFGCGLEIIEDFYPQVVARPLEKNRNLNLLSDPDPSTSGRMPVVIKGLSHLRERAGDDSFIVAMVVSPFLVAAELRSLSLLLVDFISDPSYVESLMKRVTEGIIRYVNAIIDTDACDAIMFENAGATRDLIGPHHVAQFVTPYHRQLLAAARQHNPEIMLIEHNCANRPYVSEIIDSDVDGVSFAYGDITSMAKSGDDERLPVDNRLARIGNVDHTKLVLTGTPGEVFDAARAVIAHAQGKPFVLSTGCEIPFKAPIENIRALADAVRT